MKNEPKLSIPTDYPPCACPIRETEPDTQRTYFRDCNVCPPCLAANDRLVAETRRTFEAQATYAMQKVLTGVLEDALGTTTIPIEPQSATPEPPDDEAHECDNELAVDFDLCPRCGEHTGFCSVCELSTCCGKAEVHRDHDDYDMER